ncbi:MAG: hypothetical protein H7837_13285 [Magnetococcus sp. MYC-9]
MSHYAFNPITRRLDLVATIDNDLAFVTAAVVGGQRVVSLNGQGQILHADPQNTAHAGRIVGLTLGSGVAGATVAVRRHGVVEDPGWQWDPSRPRLFLASNGTLTQTVPTVGFLCVVGFCLTPTRFFIDVQPAINLI